MGCCVDRVATKRLATAAGVLERAAFAKHGSTTQIMTQKAER